MLSLPVANSSHELGDSHFSSQPIPNARVFSLSIEHDDLDAVIDALVGASPHDDLVIARLKKRRLQIRDEIAGIAAAAQMWDQPGEAVIQNDAGNDADGDAHGMEMAASAPSPAAGSFLFSVFLGLVVLFALALSWSDLVDSLNQTLAQVYLLSLVAAANG